MCIWFRMVRSMMRGAIHSTDTILTDDEKGTKHLAFEVGFPETVNKEEAIDVIAFNSVATSLSSGNIECKVNLKRGGTMPLWAYSEHSSTAAISESNSLSTIELLYVLNKTSNDITVKHKGFEVKDKWYYTKANVVVTSDLKATPKGSSVSDDVFTGAYKAAANDETKIWSFYVPTGKKIKDARLVLEINGKEVKTQPISSDISVEFGKFYLMAVQWDGKSLKWILSDSETRGLKGKDMFSNADIEVCDNNGSDFQYCETNYPLSIINYQLKPLQMAFRVLGNLLKNKKNEQKILSGERAFSAFQCALLCMSHSI